MITMVVPPSGAVPEGRSSISGPSLKDRRDSAPPELIIQVCSCGTGTVIMEGGGGGKIERERERERERVRVSVCVCVSEREKRERVRDRWASVHISTCAKH